MKALTLVSLGVSLALGAGALFFGRQFVSEAGPEASAAVMAPVVASTRILVVSQTIEPGERLAADSVRLADWPEASVPPGALKDVSELGDLAFARGLLVSGEPVLEAKIDRSGRRQTLAANIAAGMRAVSIVVRDDTGVAGFVLPGDRVDVNEFLAAGDGSRSPEDLAGSGGLTARPVLRGVRVLAVDQTFEAGLEGARPSNTVTLEVTPAEALRLGAASQRAALGLALIGRDEQVVADASRLAQPETGSARPAARSTTSSTRPAVTTRIRVINGAEDAEILAPISPPPLGGAAPASGGGSR